MTRPHDSQEQAPRLRSPLLRRVLAACAAVAVVLLLALGTWQVHRLQWKLDLIAKVDTRVHAGVIHYEPKELVLRARCGTPLAEV